MNKAPLAVGPMARPATFYGYAWRKLSKWNYIAIGAAWINGIIWYIALEEFDASEIRNFDRVAQFNRIRERGVMHVGEEAAGHPGRVAIPASWQVGYKKWAAQQAAEQAIIDEHIEEHGITKNAGGWVSPFNQVQ